MNSFSYAIDIKRFENLLATSVDETERRTIQGLLREEKAKAASQGSQAHGSGEVSPSDTPTQQRR
jgi:hypothetical protein